MAFERRLLPFFNRPRQYGPFIRTTAWYLFGIATWFPVMYFFSSYVGGTARINGPSMYPYLNTDYDRKLGRDICYVNKWKPMENLRRGMIVTFWSPSHPEAEAVKRIVGLEGDKVVTRAPYPLPTCDVPSGHVWVEGDGAHMGKPTLDSNTYGPVSLSLITGKVTHVLWPWSSFGPIKWWDFKPKTIVIKSRRREGLQ
ncbi:MAG: hypothetical protein M1818_000452 [Claussenomyces sp. TS43310]|nr:MAG: hypothetical protein M1818_000452 [Claussenomyces sp. TS43310]